VQVSDFFVFEGFEQEVNVSISDRDFQQSIVIKQDPNKSGILSFLSKIEQQTSSNRPERVAPPVFRPRRDYGGY
tara:strand:+ start:331 stop:552 length:222 start_codon:yes stop_codon:yes gene_type:complete